MDSRETEINYQRAINDIPGTIKEIEEAIQLNPNDTQPLQFESWAWAAIAYIRLHGSVDQQNHINELLSFNDKFANDIAKDAYASYRAKYDRVMGKWQLHEHNDTKNIINKSKAWMMGTDFDSSELRNTWINQANETGHYNLTSELETTTPISPDTPQNSDDQDYESLQSFKASPLSGDMFRKSQSQETEIRGKPDANNADDEDIDEFTDDDEFVDDKDTDDDDADDIDEFTDDDDKFVDDKDKDIDDDEDIDEFTDDEFVDAEDTDEDIDEFTDDDEFVDADDFDNEKDANEFKLYSLRSKALDDLKSWSFSILLRDKDLKWRVDEYVKQNFQGMQPIIFDAMTDDQICTLYNEFKNTIKTNTNLKLFCEQFSQDTTPTINGNNNLARSAATLPRVPGIKQTFDALGIPETNRWKYKAIKKTIENSDLPAYVGLTTRSMPSLGRTVSKSDLEEFQESIASGSVDPIVGMQGRGIVDEDQRKRAYCFWVSADNPEYMELTLVN